MNESDLNRIKNAISTILNKECEVDSQIEIYDTRIKLSDLIKIKEYLNYEDLDIWVDRNCISIKLKEKNEK